MLECLTFWLLVFMMGSEGWAVVGWGLHFSTERHIPTECEKGRKRRKNGKWRMENGKWRMENGEWGIISKPPNTQHKEKGRTHRRVRPFY
jgi:hypothetical protein